MTLGCTGVGYAGIKAGKNNSGGIFSKTGQGSEVSQLAEVPLWPDQASRQHDSPWTSHGIQIGRERRNLKKHMASSSSSRPSEEFEES